MLKGRANELILGALALLVFSGTVLAFKDAFASEADNERVRSIIQAAIANPDDPARVEAFIRELPEVPAGSGRYIVEGDIAINRAEIVPYLKSFSKTSVEANKSGELIVNLGPNGKFDYWKDPASRHLSYTIDRSTFLTDSQADEVETHLAEAASDWTKGCEECGVAFEEKSDVEEALFIVRFENVSGGPIARSFFPSSAPNEFVLSIFPDYFSPTMKFDKTGVLRHELGHILGYRHEHIGNVPGCNTEGSSWERLTPYTPNSVMHYFCGGAGSFDLSLRDADKAGHRCLYMTGKPCGM